MHVRRIVDEIAATAERLHVGDLARRRATRHHRDQRQAEHAREPRFGNRGAAGRSVDDGLPFAQGWRTRDASAVATRGTVIEGIGRPRVEPGFLFDIVEDVVEVDDERSIACAWWLERWLGRRYGGSSGTNLAACLHLASRMKMRGETGSIVSLLCDRGERYAQTLFDPAWLRARELAPESLQETLPPVPC